MHTCGPRVFTYFIQAGGGGGGGGMPSERLVLSLHSVNIRALSTNAGPSFRPALLHILQCVNTSSKQPSYFSFLQLLFQCHLEQFRHKKYNLFSTLIEFPVKKHNFFNKIQHCLNEAQIPLCACCNAWWGGGKVGGGEVGGVRWGGRWGVGWYVCLPRSCTCLARSGDSALFSCHQSFTEFRNVHRRAWRIYIKVKKMRALPEVTQPPTHRTLSSLS